MSTVHSIYQQGSSIAVAYYVLGTLIQEKMGYNNVKRLVYTSGLIGA